MYKVKMPKTIAASNLYQSVLDIDIQQNFVTLGQIRQTIDILLREIYNLKCGELIRLSNHIGSKAVADKHKCDQKRIEYGSRRQSP